MLSYQRFEAIVEARHFNPLWWIGGGLLVGVFNFLDWGREFMKPNRHWSDLRRRVYKSSRVDD
jgi:hypothetical protein